MEPEMENPPDRLTSSTGVTEGVSEAEIGPRE